MPATRSRRPSLAYTTLRRISLMLALGATLSGVSAYRLRAHAACQHVVVGIQIARGGGGAPDAPAVRSQRGHPGIEMKAHGVRRGAQDGFKLRA
ncbi:hypothetical protein G6F51_014470 [Rhizopus arrhizus]|uniref:Uncharacterized protein n=1 Tax=Rhizopus oryzae TaxID=64495 RepID=A0A9P6XM78_RHIOR|nr:hypothetical protein G6F51_014470 [Rhizopus arrhizus]